MPPFNGISSGLSILEAYMLHMKNWTHPACMYSAHLMCLYVAYMWRISIFVYAAHMKKDALYVQHIMLYICLICDKTCEKGPIGV